MADNVNLATPTGTAAADDIGGILYQKVKIGWGPDNTWNELAAASGKTLPATLYTAAGAEAPLLTTVAHGVTDSGDPLKIGFKTTASLSAATPVTAGQRSDAFAGTDGVQIMRGHCNLEDIISGTASNTDGNLTEVIAAVASIKQYLTRVSLSNTHASTSVMVAIKSGSTTRWRVLVPFDGGREIFFDPPLKPNAANEAWNFDPDAAVTTIECSMNGFKSKV